MILVDANLLLYAENQSAAQHEAAVAWWDQKLSSVEPVCLCWTVLNAFIRIGTNPRVFEVPLTTEAAVGKVQSWIQQPCVRIIVPTSEHWRIVQQLLQASGTSGNLVTDAHLAALSIQYSCEICTTDSDFGRFPGIRWRNPLQ